MPSDNDVIKSISQEVQGLKVGDPSNDTTRRHIIQEIHNHCNEQGVDVWSFYSDLDHELRVDHLLPKVELFDSDHTILAEMNQELFINFGSHNYDVVSRNVEKRFNEIIKLNPPQQEECDPALEKIISEMQNDQRYLTEFERNAYTHMLGDMILSHPNIYAAWTADIFTAHTYMQLINGIDMSETDIETANYAKGPRTNSLPSERIGAPTFEMTQQELDSLIAKIIKQRNERESTTVEPGN